MTGVTTETTSGGTESKLTPLAHAIKNVDTKIDSRDCPHECHGTLSLTDDDRVICQSCRCTPDGIYLPPESDGDNDADPRRCSQLLFFHPNHHSARQLSGSNPWGSRGEDGSVERYYNSGRVILPGGHENVYDEDDERRPNGVTDEYTFNISIIGKQSE